MMLSQILLFPSNHSVKNPKTIPVTANRIISLRERFWISWILPSSIWKLQKLPIFLWSQDMKPFPPSFFSLILIYFKCDHQNYNPFLFILLSTSSPFAVSPFAVLSPSAVFCNTGDYVGYNKSCNMKNEQFRYPECLKGECHVGEVLNMVCLEPKCIQKSVICGICYDEEHRNHKIRPLKLIISNSKKYLEGLTPLTLDVEKVKASINETKSKLMTSFDDFEKYVRESLEGIRSNINAIFIKILDQIELKTGKNEQLLAALEDIKNKDTDYDVFVSLMQKLIAGVPIEPEDEEGEVSGVDIETAVNAIQAKVEKDLKLKEANIRAEIDGFLKSLQKTADKPSIFDSKIDFKFSGELKHTGITLVSDTTIKSAEGYNYHFGLLEPSLQDKGNKACKVAFKIKENSSNWLAIGACYKNAIAASNYTFNYSNLGHGAYLVSSNGGSWSSIDSAKNNTVIAFSYSKGDTITVEYDPVESKLVFRKKGTEENYTIEFESKEDDELYLCGLFYYNNDEIEFIGYDDE